MDAEFVKWLATLGVGGAIAALVFMFYRKDIKQYTELWRTATEKLLDVVKDNTAAQVKLIALIENQERNSLRKDDIAMLIDNAIERNGRK